ncbi:MAG: hypothetical protein ACR2HM_00910 [Acidimicrobiales bacterium]
MAVRFSCSHSTVPARAALMVVPAGREKSKAKAWLWPGVWEPDALLFPWPTRQDVPPAQG